MEQVEQNQENKQMDLEQQNNDNQVVDNVHHFKLEYDLQTEKQAKSLCKIMLVDDEFGPGQIERKMHSEGQFVHLEFSSKDPKKIRVAVSSFIENMILVLRTMQAFPPQ